MSTTYVDGTTPLDAAHMNALQQKTEKGAANGYASLDGTAKVPTAQLPPLGVTVPPVTNGQWLKGSGGAAVWAPITVADITGAVNGQFVKGSAGAAVWSTIADADLPARLSNVPGYISDLNNALDAGFYAYQTTALNKPPADPNSLGTLLVLNEGGTPNVMQKVYLHNRDQEWTRRRVASAWSPWIQTRYATVAGVVNLDGTIRFAQAGSFTVAHTGGSGTYSVTLAIAMIWPVPLVSALTQGAVANVVIVDGSHVNFVFTTPSAYMESAFSFVVFDIG